MEIFDSGVLVRAKDKELKVRDNVNSWNMMQRLWRDISICLKSRGYTDTDICPSKSRRLVRSRERNSRLSDAERRMRGNILVGVILRGGVRGRRWCCRRSSNLFLLFLLFLAACILFMGEERIGVFGVLSSNGVGVNRKSKVFCMIPTSQNQTLLPSIRCAAEDLCQVRIHRFNSRGVSTPISTASDPSATLLLLLSDTVLAQESSNVERIISSSISKPTKRTRLSSNP
jgi:hypothetical protein